MADYFSDVRAAPSAAATRRETDVDGVVVDIGADETTVWLAGDADDAGDEAFDANLARDLAGTTRSAIAADIIADVDVDETARADWRQRLDNGLELLGLKDRSADDPPFPGASAVTHPLIAEAMTQFNARALPELIPSSGPVKAHVAGTNSDDNDGAADRVAAYLNYRLTIDDEEWFDDTDQLLFYLPFGGSAFRKLFTDPVTGAAKARYVQAEQFIVPYRAKSLADAQRYTHCFEMHVNDIRRAIEAETYADINLAGAASDADNPAIQDASDQRTNHGDHPDETHTLYECHCVYDLEADGYAQGFALPYVITVDKTANDVLAIRRNWVEGDDTYQKRVWFSHYKFMPGFGFYGLGYLHLIGDLSQAATGALRALLDAAARSNLQGGFKAKEARQASGDFTLKPGEWKDVNLTADELARAFYTPPWPAPSASLYQLLGTLTQAGERFASTTDTQVGDANNNAPVGTTMALIEQGQKVFSAIHRRLHRAAGREYRLFAELDAEALGDDPYPFVFDGKAREIRAADFANAQVVPVSDPDITSNTERIVQAQALTELIGANPDVYGIAEKRSAHRRLLEAMHVADVDQIVPDETGQRRDPVTENQYLMTGHGATAFADQDHGAHIKIHQAMMAEYAQASGDAAQQMAQATEAHIAEHHAYAYRNRIMDQLGTTLPGGMVPASEADQAEDVAPEVQNEIARAVAATLADVPTPADQQQQQLDAEQQRKNAESQAEQQRKNAEAQAKMQRDAAAFQAKMQRDQAQWKAEMARKGVDFDSEQKRDAIDERRDEAREYAEWRAEQQRDQAGWAAKQAREQTAFELEQARDSARARRDNHNAMQAARSVNDRLNNRGDSADNNGASADDRSADNNADD